MEIKKEVDKTKLIKHETKRKVLLRFSGVLLVFLLYFFFMSWKYGASEGLLVTFLTWSFFVFCTPIADAGLLFDFPIRLITHVKMVYTEVFVWIVAFFLNVFALAFNPSVYGRSHLLEIYFQILTNPIPYWLIIIISAIGTFMSVYFGDELLEVIRHIHRKKYHKHKGKYWMILVAFVISIVMILVYIYLLERLNISIG